MCNKIKIIKLNNFNYNNNYIINMLNIGGPKKDRLM